MKTKIFQTINIDDEEYIKTLIKNYPYIELRLDYIIKTNIDNIFAQKNNTNEIITTLPIKETNKKFAYAILNKAINLGSDYIDINIESIDYKETQLLISNAKKNKCKTILSIHRINNVITHEEINSYLKQQKEKKIDFLKIVLNPKDDKEYNLFCELYQEYRNVIFLCIGKYSMESRILAINNEVPIIYALSDKSMMMYEGQVYYEVLLEAIGVGE
jgi:3-dehydroquinate dehydratase type I